MYELYYEKEGISKELYEWLLKNGYADAQLIAKWKREGYEKVRFMLFLLCSCGFEREGFVLSRERGLWSSFLGEWLLIYGVLVMLPPVHSDEGDEF